MQTRLRFHRRHGLTCQRPLRLSRTRCQASIRRLSFTTSNEHKRDLRRNVSSMEVTLAKDIYCADPWWNRYPAPNMTKVDSPAALLNSLQSAGNRLVVIYFFAKWCRSCRSLYPKLSQICRAHPDVVFLKVDWDENPELCDAVGARAFPYFHIYRSPIGRLDSFMISLSRIRKLKETIGKYSDPLESRSAQLDGVPIAFDLSTEMNTFPAQLRKLNEIFCEA